MQDSPPPDLAAAVPLGVPAQGASGPALDALATLGAAAFSGVILWSLPGFLGLPPTPAVPLLIAGGGLLGYALTGPHGGGARLRRLLALAALAAVCLPPVVLLLVPAGRSALAGLAGEILAQLAAWQGVGTLPLPAALPTGALTGLGVGLLVFWTARAARPVPAILFGFALLVLEWEFVDNTATRLFWPLLVVSLLWLAADRARAMAILAADRPGATQPWGTFAAAGLAGVVVLLLLLVVPRQGGPANLGRLGVWIDQLPVIGLLEKSTREGSLGYGPAPAGNGPGSSGTASSAQTATAAGFSLAQTGFGGSAAHLGGPVHVNGQTALVVSVSGQAVPPVLYLRGAVRDTYDGSGWVASPAQRRTDPAWPTANAGALGRAFLNGSPLPSPVRVVTLRISLRAETSANLFTLLTPLRLSAPVSWDAAGEAWVQSPPPAGYSYALSSAVLGPDIYTTVDFAPYTTPGDRTPFSPEQALRLAEAGVPVAPAAAAGLPRGLGSLPTTADLQLPAKLPARVRALARRWTAGLGDPLLEALAIQQHLQAYTYSLNPRPTPPGQDFVSYFLFDLHRGYCTYYSTAMAVLLRAVGIPSRWVEGYRTAVPAGGGTFSVTNAAAHAWVEAYIPPYGWLVFDPTPGGAPAPAPAAGTAPAHPATGLLSASQALWVAGGLPGAFLALLALGAGGNYLAERRSGRSPLEEAQAIWRAAERVGGRFGRRRRKDVTPAEYAGELALQFPAVGHAAQRLAATYGRLRYGPQAGQADGLAALRRQWQELQADWRAVSPLTYPLRRWL